ncbi:PAS fold-containing protein [Lishizhenia tianjinensis]|uniref:PAS fold-containing protein n=1 Tax=Lishizhenia tianjinensis TaxID=477690 RepID=A0A1I6XBM1_9FLAO|nr:LuxR C-terminal-related transcriptional regulator [Lishizhenia tianjinensis]SFT35700.1 PAS fold-containing protein [Lishizhenia tianjinensis]
MNTKYHDLYKEIFETFREYEGTVIEDQINKLREFDSFLPPSQSFFIVSNTTKNSFEFVSENFEVVLGLEIDRMINEGINYWFSFIHPEDLEIWLNIMADLMLFTMTEVSPEERPLLHYTWSFRVKNKKGVYVKILEHQTPTFFDEHVKPVMGVAQLTVLEENQHSPMVATVKKLNANKEYETLFYKNYSQKLIATDLSNRELDVLRLLALNKTSKEIGNQLFISSHTVDGHRRKILKKLDFSKTNELVSYCMKNQLF